MNERIKELVEQAKAYATDSTKDYTGDEPIGFMDYYTEKFAELIIRECANITLDYKNQDHYMGWVDHGEEIARQFGVER